MQNYLCTQLFWVVKTHWLTLKKIPLFMRLFIIMFLFAVGVMRAADSYSQNVLLDIEVQNQTIEKVLGEIEKQHQYLQPIITQYFIDNKSEIWLLFLIAHSKR